MPTSEEWERRVLGAQAERPCEKRIAQVAFDISQALEHLGEIEWERMPAGPMRGRLSFPSRGKTYVVSLHVHEE